MELICPAGTPSSLRAAVDAGADGVYCGFRNETNARNFPGLNFSPEELAEGVAYAHRRGAKVLVAINTFPRAGALDLWFEAVDDAVRAKADAIILCDIGLMAYAAETYPEMRLHVSVQAAAANPDAIRLYVDEFNAKRVVLPRVLSVPEIARITRATTCEVEVFVFGGLCVMAEGRCSLSSFATGLSPNMNGVCSPASHVTYEETGGSVVSRLGGFTINKFAPGEPAAYPTLCKGRFKTGLATGYIFEDPVSLDAATLLPGLKEAGVTALKIEGRQRSRAYIENVVRSFREAISALNEGRAIPAGALQPMSEGQSNTLGAYRKTWR
ncbi:peptidase U32 family protein [Microvirga sp. 17 mud 1-3]|uniref:ubiquinone anaerobic biosynthesis protein UbiU n=1 Tax=Microvirga sp. 17 mud 1-3 TaxID=2082949 RepID=UPI000D6BC781|nr:peptidase U32 family protein [Microvirga sp. 17 mud 1-3]AWM88073.1 protease [Microvirga sp. 17 mud 1-3]